MKSPFPGMDPYLERHWLDVHTKLVAYAADDLNASLPADLAASAQERIAVESDDGDHRLFVPDVNVIEPLAGASASAAADSGVVLAPYRLLVEAEPAIERFVQVVELGSGRLITVIEFLSPSNKQGEGLFAFRAERAELLAAGVNFVEVDLIRAGDWRKLLRPHVAPAQAVSAYRVTFRVASDPGAVYLHPIPLLSRLPEIPIPLRKQDSPARLDLQRLLDHAYASGRYERRLNYSAPPDPPLTDVDAAAAARLIRTLTERDPSSR